MAIRPTTDDLLGMGDFQRTNMWRISMLRKPEALTITTEEFNLRCRTSGIPRWIMPEPITAYVRGNKIMQDNLTYPDGEIELSFIETVNPVIRNMFRQWGLMYKQGYTFRQRSGTFRLAELDNLENEVYEHIMDWAFIGNYNPGELAGNEAGAELSFPSMTLHYNKLYQQALA